MREELARREAERKEKPDNNDDGTEETTIDLRRNFNWLALFFLLLYFHTLKRASVPERWALRPQVSMWVEIESRPLWCAFGSWCCAGIFIVFVVGWNWQSFNLLISINIFTRDLFEPLRQERSWFWNFNRHWTHSYVLFFLLYVVFTTRMKFNFTAHENHQKKPARESSWSSERARILCWVLWCDCVHI